MVVIVHYITYDYNVQTKFLIFRRFYDDHLDENQTEFFTEIIKNFNFADYFGYFVTDNATNNDTCVDILLRKLLPELIQTQREHRRLRCWGHILNLAAKAFLFGTNAEDFEK